MLRMALPTMLAIVVSSLGCTSDDEGSGAGGGSSQGSGASAAGGVGGGGGAAANGGSGGQSVGGGGSAALPAFRCGNPMLPMTTVSFADAITLEPTNGTGGTASGDLDGDGRDEFVAQILFRIYDWDGATWSSYPVLPNLAGRGDRFAGDIEIADMNGDGAPDIIVPDSDNSGSTGAISWFENPGSLGGTWTEHPVTTFDGNGTGNVVTHLSELEVADLDGDGWADIVVRDISHGVWVLMQQGGGGGDDWAPRRFISVLPREGLRLWDPDENGRLDLLLNGIWLETPPDPRTEDFTVHPILGMEAWYAPDNSNSAIRDYACKVEVADFNNDGRVDVVITNAEELSASSPNKPHGIAVFLQPDDRVNDPWTEVSVFADNYSWHTLMLADFDYDGSADILSAISAVGQDSAGDDISLWLNAGNGMSFTQQTISSGETVYQGIIGDADGDGDCDLVAPDHFNAGPVRYFENTTAP